MWLEPQHLERLITGETGLAFEAGTGVNTEGEPWFLLRPRGLPVDHTFSIRATLQWRRLRIDFEPGKFAGELLRDMGQADDTGRTAFRAILTDCQRRGADVKMSVNGASRAPTEDAVWKEIWTRFALHLNKGHLELGTEDGEDDSTIISRWTGRFAAAITSILPLEEGEHVLEEGLKGFPEGAQLTVLANRYERDRRNRAAAISIHGTHCRACGIAMGDRYGPAAEGFIHVHHTTPVALLGPDYTIDPASDLVPLCPNCHAVAHRRDPPFSVEEIGQMLCRGFSLLK